MSKTTKRRKAWVNIYAEGSWAHWTKAAATKAAMKDATRLAVPFVEARPGDVVLSREDREAVLTEVHRLMDSAAAWKDMSPLLALLSLRGGR